jgi:putative endonuclease
MGRREIDCGERAEMLALSFLQTKGYRLLDKNWRYSHLELDLIMLDLGVTTPTIHIVEVRSLSFPFMQRPYKTVDKKKQQRIIKATSKYLQKIRFSGEVCFDIISVVFYDNNHSIEYIENAFFPLW